MQCQKRDHAYAEIEEKDKKSLGQSENSVFLNYLKRYNQYPKYYRYRQERYFLTQF